LFAIDPRRTTHFLRRRASCREPARPSFSSMSTEPARLTFPSTVPTRLLSRSLNVPTRLSPEPPFWSRACLTWESTVYRELTCRDLKQRRSLTKRSGPSGDECKCMLKPVWLAGTLVGKAQMGRDHIRIYEKTPIRARSVRTPRLGKRTLEEMEASQVR
jgi:hypothetical protein